MYTKQEIIIRSHREGHSQRKIARDLHISRKTVKKYLDEHASCLQSSTYKEKAHSGNLSLQPVYRLSRARSKLKLTREVESAIDNLLAVNEQKKAQGLVKQMLKKKDILEQLHLQGFDIGYTTVCNYIAGKENRQKPKEAFIRQSYNPGESCEFDWGEIKLLIGGKWRKFHLAVFTGAYSNYRQAYIYHGQDTLSFQESHVRFFASVGGVYPRMVYDNMRVAVARFVGRHEKEPTRALLEMRAHYGFTHRFCNAYRGNEKGHVERSVEYVRRKAFALKDDFETLEQASSHLSRILKDLNGRKQQGYGKSAEELFAQEVPVLMPHPASELICSEQIQLRVDKYATVCYRTNRYSVPDNLVGKFVEMKASSRSVELYHGEERVGLHARSYGKHEWVVHIAHYLSTFQRKPGALAGSVALAQSGYLKKLYLDFFSHQPREFIGLLSFCHERKISQQRLEETVARLLDCPCVSLSVEKLRALLGNTIEQAPSVPQDTICTMAQRQLAYITGLMA
ncbi:IS21 family transposase [Petrimonas sulfuriphila]|jgi:transposase|uniref:IS21 family transposase n=1 Tax=Petrimonas sulfuriphila TaxID=285070 RepID=UPI002A2C3ADC|nr:IS21 family transposase [Petrimonas sp.]MDD4016279.1 IS21 family transposase [Petrimonas sp.]